MSTPLICLTIQHPRNAVSSDLGGLVKVPQMAQSFLNPPHQPFLEPSTPTEMVFHLVLQALTPKYFFHSVLPVQNLTNASNIPYTHNGHKIATTCRLYQ